jgi:hypothetical protein
MTKNKPTRGDKAAESSIDILQIERGTVEVCLLGTTPLVMNRLSEKVQRQLLLPVPKGRGRRSETTLKHDPLAEFQASPHRLEATDAATLLAFPCSGFKKALMTAALDLPGATRAQIGRLVLVHGETAPVFGVPQLFMRPVRGADIARTPDIRTRAILPAWACRLAISFVKPLITPQAVVNLLAASGMIVGVGDGRPEKGALTFGQFAIVAPDDPTFLAVLRDGGRATQTAAMDDPAFYDHLTAELYEWFEDELTRRQQRGDARTTTTAASAATGAAS